MLYKFSANYSTSTTFINLLVASGEMILQIRRVDARCCSRDNKQIKNLNRINKHGVDEYLLTPERVEE